MNSKKIFQKVSYLQYPLMLVAIYFVMKPYFTGFETIWEDYNFALIFMGLGISFSTLQDTTKTQNKFSKNVWQNPKKGKIALGIMAVITFYIILSGLFGIYFSESKILQELSFGMVVLGIGMIGLLKAAGEMFDNHRLDQNQPNIKRVEK